MDQFPNVSSGFYVLRRQWLQIAKGKEDQRFWLWIRGAPVGSLAPILADRLDAS
jgi:hypothetical protein